MKAQYLIFHLLVALDEKARRRELVCLLGHLETGVSAVDRGKEGRQPELWPRLDLGVHPLEEVVLVSELLEVGQAMYRHRHLGRVAGLLAETFAAEGHAAVVVHQRPANLHCLLH